MSPALGLAPLRHRSFRLLVGGQLASSVGDSFYAVALPWYVLADHGGALLLGTVLAAYGIPRTVLVVMGGHASDRWRPWTVMMAADAVRAAAVAALAVAAISGPARAVILVPVAVVLGAGSGMFLPGSMAIIPSLLPGSELQAGNALFTSGTEVATLVGPALGGAVVALVGPSLGFAADAVSFVISAATLAGIRAYRRRPAGNQASVEPAPSALLAGPAVLAPSAAAESRPPGPEGRPTTLRHLVRSERALQVVFLVVLAGNLGSGGLSEVALPALAHGSFHTGAAGYGALLAALAAGSVVGAVGAGQTRAYRRPAVVGSMAFLVGAAFIGVAPYLGSPVPIGVALAAMGALYGFGNLLLITAFQRWAPPEAIGRLMGLILLASFGSFPVSVALGGLVVHDWGPTPFFPAAGAIVVVAVLAGLTQPEWRNFGRAEPLMAGRAMKTKEAL